MLCGVVSFLGVSRVHCLSDSSFVCCVCMPTVLAAVHVHVGIMYCRGICCN